MREIRQAEPTDCGLAALAIVACEFGHDIDLSWLRQRVPLAARRPDLESMLAVARTLGLDARPLRAEVAELRRVRLPAILHWDFRHFVVLTRAGRRHCEIADPAAGRRRISTAELGQHFTGVLVEFMRHADFVVQRGGRRVRLRDLLSAYSGLYRYLAGMFLLLVSTQLLGIAVPIGSQLLIDEVVRGQDTQWLLGAIAGMACFMFAALVLDTLRQHYSLYTGLRVSVDSTSGLVGHILALPATRIERRTIADTISRVDSLHPVQKVLTETSIVAAVHAVTLIVTIGVIVFYSPALAALSFGAMLGIAAVQAAVLPRLRTHDLDGLVAQADARQSLLESLGGAAAVQSCGLQVLRKTHWLQAFVRASNARACQGRLAIVAAAIQGAIALLDQLAFLALGIIGIANKSMTLGTLFAVMSLRGRLAMACTGLLAAARECYLLRNHLERAGDLLLERPAPAPPRSALRAVLSGRISCAGLSFAYPGGQDLFTGFCCDVESGERVVLCGQTGTGKTTLLRLLACELEPSAGQVAFDEWDSALWDRDWLRRHFGVVRQADRLFTGTVADNISGFAPDPDPRRIRQVAQLATVWDDLQTLPLRLDTPLSDGGAGLSGGQVQRLLLARALYRQPRILFLDEATNQLDSSTERRVLGNLAGLGVTIVSIAHSPEAIRLGGRPIRVGPRANGKSTTTQP